MYKFGFQVLARCMLKVFQLFRKSISVAINIYDLIFIYSSPWSGNAVHLQWNTYVYYIFL
jgi:hypothetical protein